MLTKVKGNKQFLIIIQSAVTSFEHWIKYIRPDL